MNERSSVVKKHDCSCITTGTGREIQETQEQSSWEAEALAEDYRNVKVIVSGEDTIMPAYQVKQTVRTPISEEVKGILTDFCGEECLDKNQYERMRREGTGHKCGSCVGKKICAEGSLAVGRAAERGFFTSEEMEALTRHHEASQACKNRYENCVNIQPLHLCYLTTTLIHEGVRKVSD